MAAAGLPQFLNVPLPANMALAAPAPAAPIVYPNNLRRSFVFNNNKGGVGKTTLLFHVATQTAIQNPNLGVIIVDACPQANVSQILLGGGPTGERNTHTIIQAAGTPRTIAAYLSAYSAQPNATHLSDFITMPSQHNNKIPNNVYLLCGDPWLDLVSQGLYERANQQPAVGLWHPWKLIIESLRAGINGFTRHFAQHEFICFIDTNPAFTMYTQIAIAAGNELVVPGTPDSASAAGIKALVALIYGANPPHGLWDRWSFARQAFNNRVALPVISQVAGNRHTMYGSHGANAFTVMIKEMATGLYEEFQQRPGIFNPNIAEIVHNYEDFCREFVEDVRDLSTVGVLALRQGTPLERMTATSVAAVNPDTMEEEAKAKVSAKQIRNMTEGADGAGEMTIDRLYQVLMHIHPPPLEHIIPPPPAAPAALAPVVPGPAAAAPVIALAAAAHP